MSAASQNLDDRSRKMHSAILQRLKGRGMATKLADAMRVSESTVSRMQEDLERICVMLSFLDLKIVDVKEQTLDPDDRRALVRLSKGRLEALEAEEGDL